MSFFIKQNDTSPALLATLKDFSGVAINVTGAAIRLHMKDLSGTIKIDQAMTITNATLGLVRYDWQVGDTDTVGTYYVEFQVTYSDGSVETFPNNGNKVVSVVKELN
jgi:uncharacterized protein YfaS (alpha-2-macroglobulin family)